MPPRLTIRPVTPARWDDFAGLFEGKGAPHYCWCASWRFRSSHTMTNPRRKAAMRERVEAGTPIGLLAYRGKDPVGWCSVAPRMSFEKLERSKVMPVVDERAWTITCFFVRRDERGEGVAKALAKAAVAYARKRGASSVEAYPWDTSGLSSRHLGHSSVYKAAGLKRDEGRRWARRLKAGKRS